MNFKKSKIRSLVLLALAAVAFCGLIWFANKDRPVYRSSNMAGTDYEVGRVLRVVEDHKTVDEEMDGIWRGSMTLEVEILTGRYKGDTAIVENYFSSLYNVRVAEGDKVSIRIDTTGEDEYQVSVYNYYRVPQMIGCIVAFVLLLVLIGGKKGAKSVAGLAFTVVCILWILLPLALKGYSPLAVTILLILVCNFVSFFLIDGISTKTVVAAIGSMLGVLAGAVFALIAQNAMSITTYQMDEAETLLLITSTTELEDPGSVFVRYFDFVYGSGDGCGDEYLFRGGGDPSGGPVAWHGEAVCLRDEYRKRRDGNHGEHANPGSRRDIAEHDVDDLLL